MNVCIAPLARELHECQLSKNGSRVNGEIGSAEAMIDIVESREMENETYKNARHG